MVVCCCSQGCLLVYLFGSLWSALRFNCSAIARGSWRSFQLLLLLGAVALCVSYVVIYSKRVRLSQTRERSNGSRKGRRRNGPPSSLNNLQLPLSLLAAASEFAAGNSSVVPSPLVVYQPIIKSSRSGVGVVLYPPHPANVGRGKTQPPGGGIRAQGSRERRPLPSRGGRQAVAAYLPPVVAVLLNRASLAMFFFRCSL